MTQDGRTLQRISTKTVVFSRTGNSPEFDDLMLVNGKTVGETSTDELRSLLARFGIESAHRAGRAQIVSEYAALIKEVYDAAGVAAVKAFLEEKEKC
jgi:hypothetical protein